MLSFAGDGIEDSIADERMLTATENIRDISKSSGIGFLVKVDQTIHELGDDFRQIP